MAHPKKEMTSLHFRYVFKYQIAFLVNPKNPWTLRKDPPKGQPPFAPRRSLSPLHGGHGSAPQGRGGADLVEGLRFVSCSGGVGSAVRVVAGRSCMEGAAPASH